MCMSVKELSHVTCQSGWGTERVHTDKLTLYRSRYPLSPSRKRAEANILARGRTFCFSAAG